MFFRNFLLTLIIFLGANQVFAAPEFVGSEVCGTCHKAAMDDWRGSHHQQATGLATPQSVLGNFNGAMVETPTTRYRFFTAQDKLQVTISPQNGAAQTLPVTHTFGITPLQQYMVPLEDDRLQVLPVAWDSRPQADGGQRWFYLYDDPLLAQLPELQWDGYFHTWNGQCAECHATDLRRNYDAETDRFATTFREINVACEACHGPGGGHTPEQLAGKASYMPAAPGRIWEFAEGASIAHLARKGHAADGQVDTCAACHARRSSLVDGHKPTEPFLDQYAPALIEAPLYFADGQIHDEVYVYGSFMQSKMHQAGVVCSDCHDPHSLETRVQGNDLCAQCHLPETFDTPDHHRHDVNSDGAQCVNCHMPERTYMQVDDRRDHSFRVPRPLLSREEGARDACRTCHEDKDTGWVRQAFNDWGITPRADAFEAAQLALGRGEPHALRNLEAYYRDTSNPVIKRATALMQIARGLNDPAQLPLLEEASRSDDALIRYGLARGLAVREQPVLLQNARSLLNDPVKSVRLEAARWIAALPSDQLPPDLAPSLRDVRPELEQASADIAFMPDARMQLGTLHMNSGDMEKAIQAFGKARALGPSDARAWVNQAEALRLDGKEEEASALLEDGLTVVPEPADLHYALALSLVRQKKLDEALSHFGKAVRIAPDNERYAYGEAIAFYSAGRLGEALDASLRALDRHPNSLQLLPLAIDLAQRNGKRALARNLMQQYRKIAPQ